MSHKDCFDEYGVVPRNTRWSWSGRSPDGKVVAVRLWRDLFEDRGKIYRSVTHTSQDKWFDSAGHRELIENLAWARDSCGGEVRIIIAVAKDTKVSPRSIRESYAAKNLRMRVSHLDEGAKEFILQRID
jgi:hypothetical protein